ncbi:MAG: ATP-binding protein [Bacteriovoracaceae bacterium]
MNRKVNILVVDDRPEGIMAVQAVLTDPTYNVVPASSGNEALKALLHSDFAVILMDVQMPIMNGFETAQVIKTREKSKDIPIVFMSAINQDEQYVYQGYGVGAVDYIMKPFDPYILKSKVAIFVDMFRKNKLIQEQSQRLYEAEVKTYAQALDKLEIKSLRRYQYLADAIPQIVFRLLPSGQYEYFNKVWFEYTGQEPSTSSGDGWKNAIHPDDLHYLLALFQPHVSHGVVDLECRIKRNDNCWRWHLIRIEPERYEHPTEVKSWLGTATDIEERKREEEREKFLSKAGELLVSSLDFEKTLEDIMLIAVPELADWCAFDVYLPDVGLKTLAFRHKDTRLESKARELHELFLKKEDSNVGAGRVFKTGLPEIHPTITEETFKELAVSEHQAELGRLLGDRSVFIVPMSARGKTIGAITFAVDRHNYYSQKDIQFALELGRRIALAYENSRLYALSQQAIEIRNDFLSIASHELNTPITSLKLQLQMTKKALDLAETGELPLERFRKSVDASCKQVDRLINLVQVLLDVSRIQSGKLTFRFQKVSLKEMINEVLERFKEIIDSSNCSVKVKGLEDMIVVWDKTRIEQVIINLLTNAIKYAPGDIEIGFDLSGDNVQFSIRDHGEGIPEEKLKTIFDRFERLGNNDSVSGLGLGLFIVKQIVDGHNGEVRAESLPGKGTNFTVSLPVVVSAPAPEDSSSSEKHLQH